MSDFHYPSKTARARKDYSCDACDNLKLCGVSASDLTEDEQLIYNSAKEKGFKILKGETYVYQAGVYDGTFYVFRGIPAIVDICHKYDLFED